MEVHPPAPDETPPSGTAILLTRARTGDVVAREELFERFFPILRQWAHRRLPAGARDLNETMDLVQITLLRALNRLDQFESRGEGAFLAYLRQIMLNVVRNEARRAARR
ncbi:MAG TPA: sigma-70 family RNA polymerase sigma factor, partial [Candidatus Krumholzibacteria bacterium]|nr:sigma-70 family RNA polymerase sigma factor [Candidatus Krumholzibacteria bacterium]